MSPGPLVGSAAAASVVNLQKAERQRGAGGKAANRHRLLPARSSSVPSACTSGLRPGVARAA